MRPFYVYLLRCADGSYYCGQTDSLETRLQQHEVGEYAYTATRKPVELVWHGEFESRHAAIAFEQRVKGWSRAKKEALIVGDWGRIRKLAKTRKPSEYIPLPKSSGAGLRQAQPERLSGVSNMNAPLDVSRLTDLILGPHDMFRRRGIAKAITLLESTRADHRL